MPLTQPCILWPVRFAATTYAVRATVGGVTETLNFPASGTLTLNRNYWLSGDAQADSEGGVNGIGDLLTMLKTTLDSHSGVSFSEVSAYTGDNQVKVTASSGTFQILWAHAATTLDPTLFGFTAATSPDPAANSVLTTNRSSGCFYPGKLVTVDSRDRQPRSGGIATTLSGLSRVSNYCTPKKHRDLSWDLLTQAKALREYEDATDPFGSFEEMWLSALSLGYPVRYYEDATLRTSSSYTLYKTRSLEDRLARSDQYKVRWRTQVTLQRAD